MKNLELKVPPVAVFLVALALIHLSSILFPTLTITLPWPSLVMALCFCSSGFWGVAGLLEFRRLNDGEPHGSGSRGHCGRQRRFCTQPQSYVSRLTAPAVWACLLARERS